MNKLKDFVAVKSICSLYEVSETILINMADYDLIEIVIADEVPHLPIEEVVKFERYFRLYVDLGVNVEGLAVIKELLEERDTLREEIKFLKNRFNG